MLVIFAAKPVIVTCSQKTIAEKKLVEENAMPKYESIVLNKDVKLRKFNEYGLPITDRKFDYTKYFVQPRKQQTIHRC